MPDDVCSWCGRPIDPYDGYRLTEQAGDRRAAFCRLEHLVPWAIRGAHWDAGASADPADPAPPDRCVICDAELDDARLVLVRRRGEHRVTDAFCSVGHLQEWAHAGGRWR